MQNRRQFLQTGFSLAAAGLAGTAALTGARRSVAEEAPPETTSVRILSYKNAITCIAPLDILGDGRGERCPTSAPLRQREVFK